MTTNVNERAVKKAVALDAMRRGANIGEAAEAAGVSRRTVHNWINTDPEFAEMQRDATKNRGRRVTEGQYEAFQQDQATAIAELQEIDHAIAEVAAPALTGDTEAEAEFAALQERRQEAVARIDALKVAIASAEQHLARSRAEEAEAEAEREQHAAEADGLQAEMIASATELDSLLRQAEAAWTKLDTLGRQRQVASRRAGGRARPAFARMLIAGCFACAPGLSTAIGLDRRFRSGCRPLSESCR